jgi:hypothetical protein
MSRRRAVLADAPRWRDPGVAPAAFKVEIEVEIEVVAVRSAAEG